MSFPVDPSGGPSAPTHGAGDGGETYRVQPGDTLFAIAQAHGVSLSSLEKANPQILHPDLIHPGDAVHIPAGGSAGGADGSGKASTPDSYTVKSGDTLSGIGVRFGVDWRTLAQVNHLSDPNLIRPGEVIELHGGGGSTPKPPATTGAGGKTSGGSTGSPSLNPNQSKEQQAVSYFESQGWSHAQASGIVANLEAESGLRTDAVGDGGSAYGLGQWHPDRQAAFQGETGRSIQGSSYAQQLQFVQWELTHTETGAASALRGDSTASAAGVTVSRDYERPADADGEASARASAASRIYGETH